MISIQSLSMTYPKNGALAPVFQDLCFDVPDGQFLAIVGPSGCGKTTLLRCLAGLTKAASGRVLYNGVPVSRPSPGLSMVFQDSANSLFPWKTALENVVFAMAKGTASTREKRETALGYMEVVGLARQDSCYPWELSGGMQQRVALARALAGGAGTLLLDEPFASLDAQARAELEDLLLAMWGAGQRTFVIVTHDVDEALYLSDRVLILGGEATNIQGDMLVDLPHPRHQLTTRGDPRFSELRVAVHQLLAHGAGREAE